DIGVAAQLTIIILSLVFMIGYYVWLPAKRGKRFTEADYKEQKPPESKRETFSYSQIKKWGEIIATSIQWLQQHGSALLKWNLWISIVLTGVVFTFYGNFFESLQAFNKSGGANVFETLTALFQVATSKLQGLLYTLNLATFPWFFPAYVLGFGLFQFKIGHVFSNVINGAKSHPTIPQILLPMFLWIVALLPVFWWSDFYIVALVVLMPLIGIVTFVQQHEKLNYAASVKKSLNYALSYPGQFLLIVAVTGLLTSLLVFLTQSPLLWIAIELTNDFIGFTETTAIRAIEFGIVVLAYFTVLIGIGLCGVCFLFYYCSVKEIKEANDLQSRIQQITLKKSTYGIQKSF
ncbi:MAG: hypothetical protein LAT76_08640, partial [Schleiferiaceae bacterium]|nr:hypothetical protein [Schleiferiaceae bacterium]